MRNTKRDNLIAVVALLVILFAFFVGIGAIIRKAVLSLDWQRDWDLTLYVFGLFFVWLLVLAVIGIHEHRRARAEQALREVKQCRLDQEHAERERRELERLAAADKREVEEEIVWRENGFYRPWKGGEPIMGYYPTTRYEYSPFGMSTARIQYNPVCIGVTEPRPDPANDKRWVEFKVKAYPSTKFTVSCFNGESKRVGDRLPMRVWIENGVVIKAEWKTAVGQFLPCEIYLEEPSEASPASVSANPATPARA
jgi:Putative Actinobacterial Holin-X, holin superfamily III